MINKKKIALVIKTNNIKTITVFLKYKITFLKYTKIKILNKFYKVHDFNNLCSLGDIILIKMCSPISKTKHWIVDTILNTNI